LDGDHGPFLDEALLGAVDGRYTQAGDMELDDREHLGRTEWPPFLTHRAADRLILLGVPIHGDAPRSRMFHQTLDGGSR
jgi:hypothetical protein